MASNPNNYTYIPTIGKKINYETKGPKLPVKRIIPPQVSEVVDKTVIAGILLRKYKKEAYKHKTNPGAKLLRGIGFSASHRKLTEREAALVIQAVKQLKKAINE